MSDTTYVITWTGGNDTVEVCRVTVSPDTDEREVLVPMCDGLDAAAVFGTHSYRRGE